MASYAFIPQPTNQIGTTTAPGGGLNSLDQFTRSGSNAQAEFGVGALPQGQQYTQQGINTMSPALQFYNSILRGGAAGQAALAPQFGAINQQFNQAQQQQAMLHGRGGGTASMFAQLPYQKIAAQNNLWASMLPQAAQGVAGIGNQIGQLGLGQQQIGNQALTAALQNALGIRQQDTTENAQNKSLLAGGLSDLASAGLAGYLGRGK